ncbi:PadR family transcriptional regulator [Mycobacterium xenopi]|uniref:PadR family transcriptional regulator n=1 Tax=Mycobacterium xenopi TaxID=1789 RepID=UPI003A5997C6
MTESQAPRPRRGRAKKDKADELVTDPLTGDELSDRGDNAPVELEAVGEHQPAGHDAPSRIQAPHPEDLDVYEGDLPVEWDYDEPEPDYDEEPEFEPDDEEFELEPDYDEEADLGGRHLGPGREPRLATGPRHGPGHHDRPPHEHHGPGPKKAPGKKAVGKKAPAKKAPGPKKHPGHPPPPPHEHGPGHPPPPPHEHGPGHPPPPPHEPGSGHGPGGPGPEADFGLGPGASLGFGPGPDFGFDFGFGPGARGQRRGPGRRGRRVRPGDVRAAILHLLAERPMHGYEMIQEIAERTQDAWRPSPGSVYPTLQLLDDEGLIVSSETEGSTRLFELTDKGRAAAQKIKTAPWKQFAEGVDPNRANLRAELAQLFGAVAQSAYATTAEVQQRVVAILKNARREIYRLLADAE